MVVFLDTSSLIKRYVEEPGSSEVDKFFDENNDIHLAPTTPIEIQSVLTRRLREKSITQATVHLALEEWKNEERSFTIALFNQRLRDAAIEVIEKTGIKTLDAIQLAAAQLSDASVFVSSDKNLIKAAETIFLGRVVMIP